MNYRLGLVAVVTLAAACGGTGSTESATKDPSTETEPAEPAQTLADRVAVGRIEVLQGTTAVLLEEGLVPKKQNAAIIAGRPGLVRVHALRVDPRGKIPSLVAELRVKVPGREDVVLSSGPLALVEYDPNDLQTTHNFELAEDLFTPETSISVTLRDAASTDGVRVAYPAADAPPFSLGAVAASTTLKVKFVPVKYNPDGSGRTPVLDDKVLEGYRKALYKMYPTAKVEVSAREPLPWGAAVAARGDGWDDLLDTVMQVRRADRVEDDVYYVGVFEPAPSRDQFCEKGGCVLGIAPSAGVMDVGLRVALILGYGSAGRNGTLAQELAHAMGRAHAPCGVQDFVDDEYPYANARIGVAGYDVLEKTLMEPSSRLYDFMSYCGPVWTSDYTWAGLRERMVDVDAALAGGFGKKGTSLRAYSVDGQGNLKMGSQVDVMSTGEEGPIALTYEDGSGHVIGGARGTFRRYDSVPGGILLAPEPPAQAKLVRVPALTPRAVDLGAIRAQRAIQVLGR